jgi:hypothetical protein
LTDIASMNQGKDLSNIEFIENIHYKKRRIIPIKSTQKEYRGSPYKGVTRNGRAWSMQTNIDGENIYLGIHEDPVKAAALFDILMI